MDLCRDHAIDCTCVGTTETDQDDLDTLRMALQNQPAAASEPLWIILLGHGTFDGRVAKFNLRGPDLSAEQLQQWLEPLKRTVVIANCASASSPFMNVLKSPNRVVITSTKSGYQYNFARLGEYLTVALGDPAADLDKDGQTSLLEAYLLASSRVEEFYQQESRLATEQALLDDNGDGRGTPASWFRGVRAVQRAKDNAPVDGTRAHQLHLVRSELEEQLAPDTRQRRDDLERQVAQLRELKPTLAEDDYYDRLQRVLVELAQLYEARESGD